jgi:membrane-bound lytic murein transglycosylase B
MREYLPARAGALLAGIAAANAAPATKTAPAAAKTPSASAAPCHTGGGYDPWLTAFEREALAQGISQRTIVAAAPSLTYDQKIVYIG